METHRNAGRRLTRRGAALAALVACLLAVVLVAADVSRPPDRQLTARAALSAIRWYQAHWSGHLGVQCRFTPSCSKYAAEVIQRHGIARGGWQAALRIARCGPWTPVGTKDPPQ